MRDIPIDRITPNPFQPRKAFDRAPLDELQSSIAEYGVLVPIIVRARGDGFELIAGERRWRASAALGMSTIPAIVRAAGDRDTLEVAMVENLQREDLNALEEAAGYQHLIDEYAMSQDEVARRIGKSRPAVANTLRLLSLPESVKAMLADGRLSAGHARALLAAAPALRLELAQRTVDQGLSVRTLERLAGAVTTPPKTASQPHALTPEELDFETRLRQRYGTHTSVVRSGRGGRIELRFTDDEELIRLGDLLLGEA
ncbi:MAG: ParB/RepB/Spo0J family partition protein [Candidatus Eremiobacteraeota bacterium]|nr:ParB/RepB/Spo0J family partition protein [Candidatus Eremiobacteraeota bacterium]MBV8371841.1 ParB/RepB/Spo0J family partition protein [Candidatus Eremiobacteraeota bacterium]